MRNYSTIYSSCTPHAWVTPCTQNRWCHMRKITMHCICIHHAMPHVQNQCELHMHMYKITCIKSVLVEHATLIKIYQQANYFKIYLKLLLSKCCCALACTHPAVHTCKLTTNGCVYATFMHYAKKILYFCIYTYINFAYMHCFLLEYSHMHMQIKFTILVISKTN